MGAGPEPGRGEMQAALRATWGTDIELTWPERDFLPLAFVTLAAIAR